MKMAALPGSATVGGPMRTWRNARKVLAVRLDGLGDLLMTTPALAAIRQSVPAARLTLLASPAGAALAPCLPFVDETIAFDAPWVRSRGAGNGLPLGACEAALVARLTAARFDAAVVFTVCTQSALPAALLCRMAGIPLRLAHSRENPYGLLTDWVAETDVMADGMRHEVQRQLALVATVGWSVDHPQLRLAPGERHHIRMRALLRRAGIAAGRAYFVVHPGASAASRRYPAARFGEAARGIAQASGAAAVFTGDASEQALIEQARAAMDAPSVSLAGQLDLGELAALIGEARLLVANNTGPTHLAAAMGTPVAVLYALTNPQHTPWQVRSRVLFHDVPCRNCLKSVCPQGHHDCLGKVAPATVVDAALALMARERPSAPNLPGATVAARPDTAADDRYPAR